MTATIIVAETNTIKLNTYYIMTKKHLEFLAALINAAHNGTSAETLATLAAAYCADTNPRFDEARFLVACGTHLPPPPR
jgi:hypothetical protein